MEESKETNKKQNNFYMIEAKNFFDSNKNSSVNGAQVFNEFCSQKNIDPKKTVFVFPGNNKHHQENLTLYSVKGGKGLGEKSDDIGKAGYPTLSCPITENQDTWRTDTEKRKKLTEESIYDIGRAAGAGFNIVLPVREKNTKPYSYVGDSKETFFEQNQKFKETNFEPAFWGKNEKTPDKELSTFYIENLYKIQNFLNSTEEERLELVESSKSFPEDLFYKGYLEGCKELELEKKNKPRSDWYQEIDKPYVSQKNPAVKTDEPQSSFNAEAKKTVVNFLTGKDKGYTIEKQDENSSDLIVVRKDNHSIFSIETDQITVTAKEVNAQIYTDLLETALKLFSDQKMLIYVPEAQKKLYQEALDKLFPEQKARFIVTHNEKDYKAGKIPEPNVPAPTNILSTINEPEKKSEKAVISPEQVENYSIKDLPVLPESTSGVKHN